jgi:hypothetical protein
MSRDPSRPIPGWQNVLLATQSGMAFHSSDHASEYALGCANVLQTIIPGLQALGTMLWTSMNCEDPLEPSDVCKVGILIASLAELVEVTHCNEVNAVRAELNLAAGLDCWGHPLTEDHERIRREVIAEACGLEQAA